MSTDSEERGRIFGFEVHHQIPLEVMTNTTYLGTNTRALLAQAGFDLGSAGNKIALFIRSATRDAIASGPEGLAAVFKQAGFGFATHQPSGGHPGYNDFILQALNNMNTQRSIFATAPPRRNGGRALASEQRRMKRWSGE